MIPGELATFFDDRFNEIQAYLNLLQEIEYAARSGPPQIQGVDARITPPQQKILYSSVYLQLYNLVEATVSRCIDAVSAAVAKETRWRPEDLNSEMRSEWVRATARTHIDQSPDKRLKNAVLMCEHLIDSLPMKDFKIDVGGGGNWDDGAIEKISNRVGCKLTISKATRSAAKRPVRDDLGPLKLVKKLRNDLAHGSISFTECADGVSASELRDVADTVGAYLRETIECFSSYVDLFEFLQPERKPTVGAP